MSYIFIFNTEHVTAYYSHILQHIYASYHVKWKRSTNILFSSFYECKQSHFKISKVPIVCVISPSTVLYSKATYRWSYKCINGKLIRLLVVWQCCVQPDQMSPHQINCQERPESVAYWGTGTPHITVSIPSRSFISSIWNKNRPYSN